MRGFFLTLIGLFMVVSNFASFDSTIPVVDMQDFYNPAKQEAFVNQVGEALRDVGFFAVVNPNIDMDILDKSYLEAKKFFSLSQEEKRKCLDPNIGGQRGYVESESAKGQPLKDFKEFYHIGRELGDDELKELGYAKNIWPEDGQLKEKSLKLFQSLEDASKGLQEAISLAMGQDRSFISDMVEKGNTLVRAIHYPANPPENQIWAAAHTDINLFTILPRATADGLQVLGKDGKWITVKVPENAFIVNGSDMLTHLTNGEFRSSVHRVVSMGDDCERYSMVMFVHPRNEVDLTPRAENIARTGGEQKFATCTAWELLFERLADLGLAGPSMLQALGQSGFLERQIEIGKSSPEALLAVHSAGFSSMEVENHLQEEGLLHQSEE